MRRVPPLKALRYFEAGARHLSFTKAADELSVTQTAVSHQVKQLEQWFVKPLFQRHTRRLSLTEAGAALYPVVAQALDKIAATAARIKTEPDRRALTVSVTPTFGSRWLARRLAHFWRPHPDIDLRVHHCVHLVDFSRDDVDIAIRWGSGNWPGTRSEWLMTAVTTPLCSPRLLTGVRALRQPSDLSQHTLLHERDYQEWTEWLIAAGALGVDGRRGPVIDDPNSLVRAAVAGHGVLMGSPTMLCAELEAGRLVAPFSNTQGPEPAYYLVYPSQALERPNVRAFREFIISECAETSDSDHTSDGLSTWPV